MTAQERERNKDTSRHYFALRHGMRTLRTHGRHGSGSSSRGASAPTASRGSRVSGAHRGQYEGTSKEPTAMQRAWAAALAKHAQVK